MPPIQPLLHLRYPRLWAYLELVEVAHARQAPVHVRHHGHKYEFLAEEVYVARPVLHLTVRLLRSGGTIQIVNRSTNRRTGLSWGVGVGGVHYENMRCINFITPKKSSESCTSFLCMWKARGRHAPGGRSRGEGRQTMRDTKRTERKTDSNYRGHVNIIIRPTSLH